MKIGLVVPEARLLGGIRKHAEFVADVLKSLQGVELEIMSLAMSAADKNSVRLLDPRSWLRGITAEPIELAGISGSHVGAFFSEIEPQRFLKRPIVNDFVRRQDLVAVVAGAPSWALPIVRLGVPVVLTFASLTKIERANIAGNKTRSLIATWRGLMTPIVARFDDNALQQVDFAVVENRVMHKYAQRFKVTERVIFAPPGVDTIKFCPLAIRNQMDPYLLFVGRMMDPRKNVKMLFDAYRVLLTRMVSPPKLKLVGADALDKSALVELPDSLVEVISSPSNDELAGLYRGAIASVLTSNEEGFGFVVVEAMSSGVPVVATRCGGPEGIISDGKDGYLVECNDALALCDKLELLATNWTLNVQMGHAARAKVESKFSLKATREKHRKLYAEIAARHRSAIDTRGSVC